MTSKTQKFKNLNAQQVHQYRALLPHVSINTLPSIETIGRAINDLQTAAAKLEPWIQHRVSVKRVCQYLYGDPSTRHHLRESVVKILLDLETGKIKKTYASAKFSNMLKDDLETLVNLKLLQRGPQGSCGLFLTPYGAQVFNNWPNLKDPPIRILAQKQLLRLAK